MANYYSQRGEDFLLDQLFKDQKTGFFVEVGCIDGKRFSNTLTFEERGWKGLCVEAHPGYIGLLRQNRPNSIICHCAAGEKDEDEVTFYAYVRGTFSTLDRSKKDYFEDNRAAAAAGYEELHIPKRRLDTLFQEHGISEIDILSIDVEGYEVEVLRGIDFQQYKPLVLVIEELDSSEHDSQLDSVLIPNGYTKSVRIAQNSFYLLDPRLETKIKNKRFQVVLTHTKHPLDEGEEVQKTIQIDTHSEHSLLHQPITAMRVLKKRLGHISSAIKSKFGQISWSSVRTKSLSSRLSAFFEMGFHGDQYLLDLVNCIIRDCDHFIETGTNVGSTLAHVARTYSHVQCLSCEPDREAFQNAVKNTDDLPKVSIYNETSQEFLKRLGEQFTYLFEKNVLFWLDAHGPGFKWPLREEIAFITTHFDSAYILIDDFKVPELDCFSYAEYQGQECSFDYIKDALNLEQEYTLYYPNYTERTSEHHPLRGWALIEFGHDESLKLPSYLQDKVRRIERATQQ